MPRNKLERPPQEDVVTREVPLETPSPDKTPTIKGGKPVSEQPEVTPAPPMATIMSEKEKERRESFDDGSPEAEKRRKDVKGWLEYQAASEKDKFDRAFREEVANQRKIKKLKDKIPNDAPVQESAKEEEQPVLAEPKKEKHNWFRTLSIAIVAGLGFTAADRMTSVDYKPNAKPRTSIESKESVSESENTVSQESQEGNKT